MDDSRGRDAWRKDGAGAPHHAVAAEMLGVESWVIDGVIDPHGAVVADGAKAGR